MKKYILSLLLFLLIPLNTVSAQGICDFIPCNVPCADGSCDALGSTTSIIRWGVSLIFVGIIIFGVFLIIKASLKIIRSEGNESMVQEGAQSIRGVFIGLIVIFIGIIGVVIIAVLFNAEGIFGLPQPEFEEVPINIPTL